MSSLIAAMLNSADDHQTKPNMKYIKYEIYHVSNISNISYIKYIKCEIYQKWNMKYKEN